MNFEEFAYFVFLVPVSIPYELQIDAPVCDLERGPRSPRGTCTMLLCTFLDPFSFEVIYICTVMTKSDSKVGI